MKETNYQVPWLADFFHSFPHFNFTFQSINSKFDPENANYQESLIAWAAIPVLVLVLALIFFLVFYCCRCFRRSQSERKPTRGKCFIWTIGVFALIACAAVAIGFYGNEDIAKGILKATTAVDDLESDVTEVKGKTKSLENNLNHTVLDGVHELRKVLDSAVFNGTVRSKLDGMVDSVDDKIAPILQNLNLIEKDVKQIDMKKYINGVKDGEYYRWMSTIVIFSWTLLVALLWLIAIGKSSRGMLFVCAVLGMLTLAIAWIAAGLHTGAAVAVGDLCVNPDKFIKEQIAKNGIEKEVLVYYLKCNETTQAPFRQAYTDAWSALNNMNTSLGQIDKLASPFLVNSKYKQLISDIFNGISDSLTLLQQVGVLADCNNIHEDYKNVVKGVCYLGLSGLAFILLAFLVVGVSVLLMLVMAPFAWRRLVRRRRYVEVDEDDPFLPRQTSNSNYHRYGSVTGRPSTVNVTDNSFAQPGQDQVPLEQGRSRTPPPAYGEHENRTLSNRNTFQNQNSSDVF